MELTIMEMEASQDLRPTSWRPRVFVRDTQQRLLDTELPEAGMTDGENRNWVKI